MTQHIDLGRHSTRDSSALGLYDKADAVEVSRMTPCALRRLAQQRRDANRALTPASINAANAAYWANRR